MTLSRRSLIHLVGKAGGVAAAYHTMAAMGLMAVPAAYAGPPALPPGRGRRVVIVGAGIAGMVLAYELRKAGYRPLVLEARERPGGRNWSLRGGDTVVERGSVTGNGHGGGVVERGSATGNARGSTTGIARGSDAGVERGSDAGVERGSASGIARGSATGVERGGDTRPETGTTQHVGWDRDSHLYFNPGPARLPYHHEGILSYCRALDVPLEVLCNDNRGALMQDDHAFNGAPQRNRRVVNDLRGFVAELAAKATDKAALAQPVSAEDQERLRDFLRDFGALDQDLVYRGSSRAGWAQPPDATQPGKPNPPLDLRQLLASDFWQGPMQFGESSTQAATMMQPVGGMGRIGQAFGRALAGVITYQAVVTRLQRTETGVRITWKRGSTGAEHRIDASCVVVTVPFSALGGIDADFSPATRTAMASVAYVPAGKVAFQASRRFWEEDAQIYGGISWTGRDATQVWYPSAGLQRRTGILVGAYIWSEDLGNAFAAKPLPQRLSDTMDDVAHLHPGAAGFLGHGVSVAWKNIPYTQGGWAEWTRAARATQFPVLLQGDGPYLFAGEHMSFITGWQEGAVRSAHKVLGDIAVRMRG